jgi:glycosyltransferase involved in cell wall biosynthesis
VHKSEGKLSVLHLILAVRETSAPYNEHCLPLADKNDISICTYFPSDITPPPTIVSFAGDGSFRGFFRVLKAALGARDYHVIHVHSPHLGLLFLMATLFSRRRFARSTVMTVHDSYQNFKLRNRLMLALVFAGFHRVICCSRASYDSFPAFFKWLAGRRLGVVQNGVDIERVDRIARRSQQTPRDSHRFTVTAISRLVAIKNPFLLLAAFHQSAVPESYLVQIGDGPLRDKLVELSREAGLEQKVEYTGLIPREKVFEYLVHSDLFVSASRGEGLPVSVLEAMACQCPVLLSDIVPHREIAESVDFIPLVAPDDVAGFAQQMRKFQEMPPSERIVIGQKCRKLVEDRFSLRAMQAQYEQIYSQIRGSAVAYHLDAVSVQTK